MHNYSTQYQSIAFCYIHSLICVQNKHICANRKCTNILHPDYSCYNDKWRLTITSIPRKFAVKGLKWRQINLREQCVRNGLPAQYVPLVIVSNTSNIDEMYVSQTLLRLVYYTRRTECLYKAMHQTIFNSIVKVQKWQWHIVKHCIFTNFVL